MLDAPTAPLSSNSPGYRPLTAGMRVQLPPRVPGNGKQPRTAALLLLVARWRLPSALYKDSWRNRQTRLAQNEEAAGANPSESTKIRCGREGAVASRA